ncbi:MAG: class I SAM-dependent methyltransferase [Planctomycetes bacterium]|nr:class I SAM-dependent methyltransferase [Planctomycetota bacterium]
MTGVAVPDNALALQLGLASDTASPLVLEHADSRLQLRDTRRGAPGPLFVDFHDPAAAGRQRAGRGLLLARAVGVRKDRPLPRVADATAGLGRDTWALAALGCTVDAIERSPVVAALLQDGLRRAPSLAAARIRVHLGDAREVLPRLPGPDVVLLDPMYPRRGRTARSAREMQYLQELLGEEDDAAELLACALAVAPRVVVKRPRKAAGLGGKPSHTLEGESTRFDVYLRRV